MQLGLVTGLVKGSGDVFGPLLFLSGHCGAAHTSL